MTSANHFGGTYWLFVGMILFKQIIEYKAIKANYRMLQIDKQR